MATFEVTERIQGTDAGESDGQDSTHANSRFFHVLVIGDPTGVTAATVRALAPLPGIGMPHPQRPQLFCRRVNVDKVSPVLYEAEAEYFAPTGGEQESPTLKPAVLRWSHAITDEEIDQTAQGLPIITVTGESFDPPIRRQFGDLVLTIERNVAAFDPLLATEYLFTTNSDAFMGFPPGCVLCTQFQADLVTENENFQYWSRTIAFQFRRGAPNTIDAKAWYRRVRAEGYYIRIPTRNGSADPANADRKLFRAFDSEGQPTVKPVLHSIATGELIASNDAAQWYEFPVYPSKPFSLLLSI